MHGGARRRRIRMCAASTRGDFIANAVTEQGDVAWRRGTGHGLGGCSFGVIGAASPHEIEQPRARVLRRRIRDVVLEDRRACVALHDVPPCFSVQSHPLKAIVLAHVAPLALVQKQRVGQADARGRRQQSDGVNALGCPAILR